MESYEEYVDAQSQGGKIPTRVFRDFLAKLEFIHWIMIVALILLINSLIKKGENPNWLFLILGAILIMWILSLMKVETVKQIPRHIAEKIALNDLQRLVEIDSAYPHGTKVIATGVFKAHHMDSGDERGWRLDKYNFGFKLKVPGRGDVHLIYQMSPFAPGECQGIIYQAMRWEGEDIKDYQIIIPEKTIFEEKK